MKAKKTDFIVGFVITISIIILIFGVMFLKEYNIGEKTILITALFDDVGTLSEGDPVKINGVKLGKVTKRVLEKSKVLVTMEINASVFVPEDSRVTIQNVGLMGERMIGIKLGKSTQALDTNIPMPGYFDSGIAEAMGMLGEVFKDAQDLIIILKSLMDQTINNDEFINTFKVITNRLDKLTLATDHLVAGNEASFNLIIKDIRYSTSELKSFLNTNKEGMNKIVNNFADASDRTATIIDKAESIATRVDKLVEKLNSEEGTVGKLLKDEELYATLKSTVTEADSLLKTINKNKGKIKVKIGF